MLIALDATDPAVPVAAPHHSTGGDVIDTATPVHPPRPAARESESTAYFTRDRIGKQFVIDAWGVEPGTLRDPVAMDDLARSLADACQAKVLNSCAHQFEPTGGLTVVAILSSSHVALHTWPEFGYLAVDLFCCNSAVQVDALEQVLVDLGGGGPVVSSFFARPQTGAPRSGPEPVGRTTPVGVPVTTD